MKLTAQRHAMYGLKVTYEKNEKHLSDSIEYNIKLPKSNKTIQKRLNKCHEFINKDIQDWLTVNGYIPWEKGNPPVFKAELVDENTVEMTE